MAGGAHDIHEIDLSPFSVEQRTALELSLRSDGVRHEFAGDVLRFPAVWQRRVEMHLEDALTRTFKPGHAIQPYRPYATVGRAMAGVPYPRPWRRLVAAAIDSIVLGVPVALLSRADLWAIGAALSVVYVVGLTAWTGQTVGKLAVRIRVVDETNGESPSVWRSIVRWFVAVGVGTVVQLIPGPDSVQLALAWVSFAIGLVVLVPILFDERRRGLHDRLAGTVVVDASVRSGDELVGLDPEELAESH